MKKILFGALVALFPTIMLAQNITVDFNVDKGPIKPLNGVNGGVQEIGHAGITTDLIREAGIPYFRSHDLAYSNYCLLYTSPSPRDCS